MELFGENIAEIIDDCLGDDLLPAVLTSRNFGARDPGNLTGGNSSTEVDYPTTGVMTGYSESYIDGTTILAGDRRIRLVANRLPQAPAQGDIITIEGDKFTIININRDAAGAMYICHSRRLK